MASAQIRRALAYSVLIPIVCASAFVAPLLAHAQGAGGLSDTGAVNTEADAQSTQAAVQAGGLAGARGGAGGSGNCSFFGPSNWFQECIWFPLLTWLGSWFLTIGGYILQFSGTLFDTLIFYVIIDFKDTLDDTLRISGAINTGWEVFRDFSNVLIIGIFVFIAISIILGLKEFGQKKLIANVLIVAILINFSLLFTKMIIDASNFTAFQIYRQMAISEGVQGTPDVAGAFLAPMGITSVWNDTLGVTRAVGNQVAGANRANAASGAFAGYAFGLVGGIFLIAAAAVLLYGSFLIAARGILFIFLMLTAALAFATYLLPSLAKGEYGWSSWWKSLLNNAIFAPLLMIFLAVSLSIVNAAGVRQLSDRGGGGNLGAIISDPAGQLANIDGWNAVLVYIIGVGLLFVSFRMAGKFAGTISGFSLAAAIPALGLAAGARLGGVLGRQAIGRPSAAIGARLQEASQDKSRSRVSRQLLDFSAQRFKGVAKRDFNAARTPLGGVVAGVSGISAKALAGKELGGFEGGQKALADRLAKQASRMTADAEGQRKQIEKAIGAEIRNDPQLAREHGQASRSATEAEKEHGDEQGKLAAMHDTHAAEMKELHTALEEARRGGDDSGARSAQQNIAEARARQAQAIQEQTDRIKKASEVVEHTQAIRGGVEDRASARALATGRLPTFSRTNEAKKTAADLARNRLTSVLFTDKENDRLAKLAGKLEGEHHAYEEMKKSGFLKAIKEAQKHDEHEAPTPKAAPSRAAPVADAQSHADTHPPAGGGGDHSQH